MASVKAIELKGIVHNTTKIGVQDGQAEDIVNLRFKDGAWRSTGDGKLILEGIEDYSQLFIHTNVYRHLLGVKEGKLWWIASAPESDPNAFEILTDEDDELAPIPICDVTGDVTITQTGHLLTIISDSFSYRLFKPVENAYVNIRVNGEFSEEGTGCFPFEKLKFGTTPAKTYTEECEETITGVRGKYIELADKSSEDNHFYGNLLVVCALRMYDGSYGFATNPVFIRRYEDPFTLIRTSTTCSVRLKSFDLCIRIGKKENLELNRDIFTHVCVFVTPQVSDYDLSVDSIEDDGGGTNTSQPGSSLQSLSPTGLDRGTIIERIMRSPFYLVKEYAISDLPNEGTFVKVSMSTYDEKGLVKNILQQDRLPSNAFDRSVVIPKVSYSYNGRLHLADYTRSPYCGYPLSEYCLQNLEIADTRPDDAGDFDVIKDIPDIYGDTAKCMDFSDGEIIHTPTYYAYVYTEIETDKGIQTVITKTRKPSSMYDEYSHVTSLSPIICFPDYRAKNIKIVHSWHGINADTGQVEDLFYGYEKKLSPHKIYNLAYCFDKDSWITQETWIHTPTTELTTGIPIPNTFAEKYPNGIKVSKTDNPINFPVENTYQIGSAEIVAMCSNAIAVGTGQTGSAPLYVFCRDGIYALFVDASGEMTYTNARVVARDVCNNPKSVTPIDNGVVFTTDRGLMMISGSEVVEIGQPLEGDYKKFTTVGNIDYDKVCANAFTHSQLGGIASAAMTDTDFLTYLKNAIVAYNHNERELMVSNPSKSYSYVLDREGNWTRRDYKAKQYVENYPVTYRLLDGDLIQLDADSDGDNGIFAMSNVVKLDSIGFKAVDRIVARGYFETIVKTTNSPYIGIYVFGSYDGRKWACLGHKEKQGKFTDLGCNVERTDCKFFRFLIAGQVTANSRLDYFEVSEKQSRLSTKIR